MKFDCWFKIDQKWKYFFMWNFHTDFRKIMFIDGFSFWADLFRRKYSFDLFLTNHFGVIQNCFEQMDCFWVDFRWFFWIIWKNLRGLGFNRHFQGLAPLRLKECTYNWINWLVWIEKSGLWKIFARNLLFFHNFP